MSDKEKQSFYNLNIVATMSNKKLPCNTYIRLETGLCNDAHSLTIVKIVTKDEALYDIIKNRQDATGIILNFCFINEEVPSNRRFSHIYYANGTGKMENRDDRRIDLEKILCRQPTRVSFMDNSRVDSFDNISYSYVLKFETVLDRKFNPSKFAALSAIQKSSIVRKNNDASRFEVTISPHNVEFEVSDITEA